LLAPPSGRSAGHSPVADDLAIKRTNSHSIEKRTASARAHGGVGRAMQAMVLERPGEPLMP
jgi:hypothetical protein